MKAMFNRVSKEEREDILKRTMFTAEEMLRDHFYQVAYRCYGIAFLGLNKSGWGKERLKRLWDIIGELSDEFAIWEQDGVDDYILAKRLRECGADYIADVLDEFAEKDSEENRKRGKAF